MKFNYYVTSTPLQFFVLKKCLLLLCYIQVHFRQDCFIEANNMNPDETWSQGSSLIWIHIVCNIAT